MVACWFSGELEDSRWIGGRESEGREFREKGEPTFLFLFLERERTWENGEKMALVALNSSCGYLPICPST